VTARPSTPIDQQKEQAAAAARAVVTAFGAHDVEAYFAGFAPSATFVFHTEPGVLGSRQEYRERWVQWEREGFRVVSCTSSEARTEVVADGVALFTHRVQTLLGGAADVLHERESIVLARQDDGRWLVVHEHLSNDPATDPGEEE
jgi:ketosteroid isomerase-like protein